MVDKRDKNLVGSIGNNNIITKDYGGLLVEVVGRDECVIAFIILVKVEVINNCGLCRLKLNTVFLSEETNSGIDVAVGSNQQIITSINEINKLALIK
jgi:hypothetical protein